MPPRENDCLYCSLKICEQECFDRHPGSRIALGKIVNSYKEKEIDIKITQ